MAMKSSSGASSTTSTRKYACFQQLSAAQYPDADWLAEIYRAAKPVPPPTD
jgi:hypothetical protein